MTKNLPFMTAELSYFFSKLFSQSVILSVFFLSFSQSVFLWREKQGRIHGNPVADSWAGAVMQKPLGIQKCDGRTDGRTDGPTRQSVESRVHD